jgi:hypothetical protein
MLGSGSGVTIAGKLVDIRNHTVHDSLKKHHRYVAIVVDVFYIRNRVFKNGVETDAPMPTEKIIGKGYLNKYGNPN